jgi:hypothetical protein
MKKKKEVRLNYRYPLWAFVGLVFGFFALILGMVAGLCFAVRVAYSIFLGVCVEGDESSREVTKAHNKFVKDWFMFNTKKAK